MRVIIERGLFERIEYLLYRTLTVGSEKSRLSLLACTGVMWVVCICSGSWKSECVSVPWGHLGMTVDFGRALDAKSGTYPTFLRPCSNSVPVAEFTLIVDRV